MGMTLLHDLRGPSDLRSLGPGRLADLAAEVRTFLVASVCRTGGHLGPNLGVVELTIALHRTFDSPRTPIVFDTGHQAYVHKLLTGRLGAFGSLRRADGLSGYPRRDESPHDLVENSHASTALAYAHGLSLARAARGEQGPVVAVVGDGALTGGLAWEALNNLGVSGRPVVVVVNDNGRSYAPTAGGLPRHLARLADRAGYDELLDRLGGAGYAGPGAIGPSLFEALGLDYLGPVDGHDVAALETALAGAAARQRPVAVHCLTRKGLGYWPAEHDEADRLHSIGVVEPSTGRPAHPATPTWTTVFGAAVAELAARRPDLVAVSAAMVGPTGLGEVARRFPDRCVDVGIAEQEAVTSAAGMAMGGLHPVVAVYSTFLGRAFDQTLMDVALHRLPVTFVLDRAGVTGPDGPSHHGIWDLAVLGIVPGMRVAAPRDPATLVEELQEAVAESGGPTALRFPKAPAGPDLPAVGHWEGLDLLWRSPAPTVLLLGVGVLAGPALEAARQLEARGVGCTVVDPRWVLPVSPALVDLASCHRLVVTAEDGVRTAGVGTRLAQRLTESGATSRVRVLGLPDDFLPQGTRRDLLARHGLDTGGIVAAVRAELAQHDVARVRHLRERVAG
jgi:1-deoxy-D-xylulose-5-phosphate synthase